MSDPVIGYGHPETVEKKASAGVVSFAKVFFYMFIGLAITIAVAFGVGAAVYVPGWDDFSFVDFGNIVATAVCIRNESGISGGIQTSNGCKK